MTKGTFFTLAQFRAATEKRFPGSVFSVPYGVCCLAVLVSPTDWQQDKSYTTWCVWKRGCGVVLLFFFFTISNVTSRSSSACTQGSFYERYFIWIPKEGSQWPGSELYCVHVCLITLCSFWFTVQVVLTAAPGWNLLLAHYTTTFTEVSLSPLPGAVKMFVG